MRKRKPAWTRWAGSTTRRWALAIATAWAAIRCSPTPSASRSCPTICAWTHPAPMARSTWCDATTWAAIRSGSTMRRCVLVKYILWILLTFILQEKWIRHTNTGQCLQRATRDDANTPLLRPCSYGKGQQWLMESKFKWQAH